MHCKAALAREAGADHVILYRDEDVAARVRDLTGGAGVRVVFDGVGRQTWTASLDATARRGLIASYGNASGTVGQRYPLRDAARAHVDLEARATSGASLLLP